MIGDLCAVISHQHLMYSNYYDMIPVMLIPRLRLANDTGNYCDNKFTWCLYWQHGEGLVMTLMTGEGLVMIQVMILKSPWQSEGWLVTTLRWSFWQSGDNPEKFDENIWQPQMATFIAKIESCMSCRSMKVRGLVMNLSISLKNGCTSHPTWISYLKIS